MRNSLSYCHAFLGAAGVALVGWASLATAAPQKSAVMVLGEDCATIYEKGFDKQDNMRATLIRIGCGLEPAGDPELFAPDMTAEALLDAANVNTITGTETFPKVTQSESMVWATPDGTTIVVNYNDSSTAPGNYSGVSVSTNGGAFFTRLLPAPFASGHGTNYGDPIVVFNARLNRWFAGDLATGCGGQGIGMWTSLDGLAWSTGACAHTGSSDDRESMWVDNNGGSPFYGRMYISWNDFAAGQRIYVTYSDDGTIWSAAVPVSSTFYRNVQMTGSPDTGAVFIAAMDEGSGGLSSRQNIIFRSITGGTSWTQNTVGARFGAPGSVLCGYFAAIPPIWRHMGWGQPGVGPGGVVHYAYAGQGVNAGDTGDIFYVRSTDNGSSWSSPIVLNSDSATGGNRTQWMPSLAVTPSGTVQVSWYDRRNSTDGNNYEYWGIQSPDNGSSWLPNQVISDRLIAEPEQPDSAVQACYAGDYNYHSAGATVAYATWTDGRNPVAGHFQQDVYFAALSGTATGGTLQGHLTSGVDGSPVPGAQVRAQGPVDRTTNTGADGGYSMRLPAGTYAVSTTAYGFLPATATGVVVTEGGTTVQDFVLAPVPAHSVSGTVTSLATGLPIAGAQVTILNTPLPPATTGSDGTYLFPIVLEGNYNIQATAPGFRPSTQPIAVFTDVVADFALDSVADCARVAGNLVVNCGFETGDFTGWTRSGDQGFTNIDAISAHSGSFGLDTGPTGDLGFIAQNLATTSGASYSLCYWLANTGGSPNRFQVSWGGVILRDDSNLAVFPYAQSCVNVVAPSDSTELKFGFQQVPSYFYFDDVSVAAQ